MIADDRRLVAACMLGSFDGTVAPAWLLSRVRDGLGGVLLFAQNVVDDAQVAALCATLRAAREDVIIAIDEEGGDVTRLDAAHGSVVPSPAAFGVVDDVELTRAAFARLGRRVRSLGIDLTLAPCADINSNPLNPIIGLRAFGPTADVVARHAVAAVDGFRSAGLAVCLKHYPGHGDTSADTHLEPARITASLDEMAARELVPFGAAIARGADAVLTAHLVADALDGAPVSLSARWTEHLRRTTGFSGVVITDALDMDAVALGRGIDGVADAAVTALAAGADLLCLGSNFDDVMTETVINATAAALASGGLDRSALCQSASRIANLRHRAQANDGEEASDAVDAARIVASRAIHVDGPVPPGPYSVLECRPRLSMACFNVRWGVAEELAELGWPTATITAKDPVEERCTRFVHEAGNRPVLVVVRDAEVHAWQRDVVQRIVALRPVAVVVVEMGWPSADPVPGAIHVVTYGASRSSADALIGRLVEHEIERTA